MGSSIVYALVLIAYNGVVSDVSSARTMSWHGSLHECHQVMIAERTHGRKEYYNESYTCLRVSDAAKAAEIRAIQDQRKYPVRSGSNWLLLK
jgi:hypothetical protein